MRKLSCLVILGVCVWSAACGAKRSDDDESDPTPAPTEGHARDVDSKAERGLPNAEAAGFDGGGGALTNLDDIVDMLGLEPYHWRGFHGQDLTIAVLDNGFAGLASSVGRRLPPDTDLLEAPNESQQQTDHGLKMAEIAYAVASGSAHYAADVPGPRMLLVNTNGYTNFKAAIDRVIAEQVDIVLYAQVWEYGGNMDGGGFINREVRRATNAGILWINAAGNLGQATWSGPVEVEEDGRVVLPHDDKYVRFTVPADQTAVKIVLSWNDFDESKDYRTPQDLDLVLEDLNGQEIAAGRLVQSGEANAGRDSGSSAHAREIINLPLPAGTYRLRVEARSKNFDAKSRLRITVDGYHVRLLDRSTENTVLIPADNPTVLTVGATDVDYSGRRAAVSGATAKPELGVRSKVSFEGGVSHKGTSAASAIAAGALAVYASAYGMLDRDDVVSLIAREKIARASPCVATNGSCLPAPVLELARP